MSILAFLSLLILHTTQASPFDPHPHPARSLFFDGWYARTVDHKNNVSFAVILGVSQTEQDDDYTQTWLALLLSTPSHTMETKQVFLNQSTVNVISRSNSDAGALTSFRVESSDFGYIDVQDTNATIKAAFPSIGVNIEVSVNNRSAWDPKAPNTDGPESWMRHLSPIVPLHYFVYELGSNSDYRVSIKNSSTSDAYTYKGQGHTHMETNYGKMFPRAWLWAEGMNTDDDTRFVMAWSKLPLADFIPPITTLGFRSKERNWDMATANLDFFKCKYDSETTKAWWFLEGSAPLLGRKMVVNVSAPLDSFSDRLYIPTKHGFQNQSGSIESFVGVASFQLYELGRLVANHTIDLAALEFGGSYVSNHN